MVKYTVVSILYGKKKIKITIMTPTKDQKTLGRLYDLQDKILKSAKGDVNDLRYIYFSEIIKNLEKRIINGSFSIGI